MKKLILFILSSVCVFAATVFYRLGGYKSVSIEIKNYPALELLFKQHIGPYHTINDTLVSVESWAAKHNLPCTRTFGEYLDDPNGVDERRLRANVGCILNSKSIEPTDDLLTETRPEQKYLIARFDGAPSIGPMKVYPKVEDFLREHRMQKTGPVIEIYTIRGEREAVTEYLFTVSQ